MDKEITDSLIPNLNYDQHELLEDYYLESQVLGAERQKALAEKLKVNLYKIRLWWKVRNDNYMKTLPIFRGDIYKTLDEKNEAQILFNIDRQKYLAARKIRRKAELEKKAEEEEKRKAGNGTEERENDKIRKWEIQIEELQGSEVKIGEIEKFEAQNVGARYVEAENGAKIEQEKVQNGEAQNGVFDLTETNREVEFVSYEYPTRDEFMRGLDFGGQASAKEEMEIDESPTWKKRAVRHSTRQFVRAEFSRGEVSGSETSQAGKSPGGKLSGEQFLTEKLPEEVREQPSGRRLLRGQLSGVQLSGQMAGWQPSRGQLPGGQLTIGQTSAVPGEQLSGKHFIGWQPPGGQLLRGQMPGGQLPEWQPLDGQLQERQFSAGQFPRVQLQGQFASQGRISLGQLSGWQPLYGQLQGGQLSGFQISPVQYQSGNFPAHQLFVDQERSGQLQPRQPPATLTIQQVPSQVPAGQLLLSGLFGCERDFYYGQISPYGISIQPQEQFRGIQTPGIQTVPVPAAQIQQQDQFQGNQIHSSYCAAVNYPSTQYPAMVHCPAQYSAVQYARGQNYTPLFPGGQNSTISQYPVGQFPSAEYSTGQYPLGQFADQQYIEYEQYHDDTCQNEQYLESPHAYEQF